MSFYLYLYQNGTSIQATNVPEERKQPLALISGHNQQRAIKLMEKHHGDRYKGKNLMINIR